MTFLTRHRTLLLIFALALVLRVFYLGISYEAKGELIPAIKGADTYFDISQNILAGNGFTADLAPPYRPNSVRPPVMPYFIAGAYTLLGSYWLVVLVHIVIASVLPLIAMRLSSMIIDSRRIALAVGLFLAVEPFTILFSTIFYSETIFMLFFFLFLYYLFDYLKNPRYLSIVLAGALLGIAALTKPTVQFLPVLIAPFLLFAPQWRLSRRSVLAALAFIVAFVVMISPWLYRNYVEFNTIGISSLAGSALDSVLVPSVLSVANGTTWGQEFEKRLAEGAKDPNDASVADQASYTSRAIRDLLAHPVAFVIVCLNTGLNFFIHDGFYDVLRHLDIRPTEGLGKPALFLLLSAPLTFVDQVARFAATPFILILPLRLFWILLTGFFIYGAIRFLIKVPNARGVAALIVIAYFAVTTLTIGHAVNARFRLPVNALIVTFAAYGVATLMPSVRRFTHHA